MIITEFNKCKTPLDWTSSDVHVNPSTNQQSNALQLWEGEK